MNSDKLMKKLEKLMKKEKYQEIIDTIEALSSVERDYGIEILYASALSFIDHFDESIGILNSIANEGMRDSRWHYRMGYCQYYLGEYKKALESFTKTIELGDDSDDVKFNLELTQRFVNAQNYYEKRWQNRNLPESEKVPFEGFDFKDFWDDNDYAIEEYVCESPSDELIESIEKELGYKLPQSYIWLMKHHNGGIPNKTCFPSELPTSWSEDCISINGIYSIGREKESSLCGTMGSKFWIEEWGYPEIGIAICDCPSAGHDMIFLDYSKCGPEGEPAVVHIDQEFNYMITYLADSFESFIKGLFDDEEI